MMENGGDVNRKISAEDVISKIKDDGDFDRLRLKIIRKLKENEDLRNSIKAIVKQSAALNRPGAETMKRRQLSDAIHQEVGDKVMGQISDGLWEIIRSADGMKSEITETVQSVYVKLTNPEKKEKSETSSPNAAMPLQQEAETINNSVRETDETMSDVELEEPPGFSLSQQNLSNNDEKQTKEELQQSVPHDRISPEEQNDKLCSTQDVLESGKVDSCIPPGNSAVVEPKQSCDNSEEDPEVPPGFG